MKRRKMRRLKIPVMFISIKYKLSRIGFFSQMAPVMFFLLFYSRKQEMQMGKKRDEVREEEAAGFDLMTWGWGAGDQAKF